MSHFAKVENGIVTQVLVAEQDFINTGAMGHGWIQTSYNTHGGVHNEGGTPLRKNYAGVGYTYDNDRDAFIPPQPFPSWILNEDTCYGKHQFQEIMMIRCILGTNQPLLGCL